jgi:hypothetical protein
MLTCRLTIKVKDYFPKTESIPFSNYICLFTCGEYQGQIPFLPDDSKFLQHQMKNITSDIKYKVHILDFNDMALIGMCEMTISYKVINQLTPPNGLIQEQQKKLLIDSKTKRKLFGTIINSGDIYLKIYAEVILISKNNNGDIKSKNSRLKKIMNTNTPKCYIKYNFQVTKGDSSPKSSKNNKLSMLNGSSEKPTLNISKQEISNKNLNSTNNSNNNIINYRRDNEKKISGNYSNFNIVNNMNKIQQKNLNNGNNGNDNLSKEQNKKNIMDLLAQKKVMEEIGQKYNKSDMDENIDDNYFDNKNFYINNKEGYLTEENFNPNYGNRFFNKNNKRKQNKINEELELNLNMNNNNNKNTNRIYQKNSFNNKNKSYNNYNESFNNNNMNTEEETQNLYFYSKNTLSPPTVKNIYIEEENIFNNQISKSIKNCNNIPLQLNKINNKSPSMIYSSKNKMIKMGKIYTKRKIKDNTNHINKKINKDIIPSSEIYNNDNDINDNNNNYPKKESNNNVNTTLSTYSGDDDYLDIDRIILDKGAELRNDFLNQMKLSNTKNNYQNDKHHKIMNSLNNNTYLTSNDDQNFNALASFSNTTNFNSRTPYTEKMSKYSSTQSLNNCLTQEDVKNNCLKLIEFYGLLNLKLKKIYPKNIEIINKLNIYKELLSSELKKNNIISNSLNILNYKYNISKNINEYKNQKILSLFPKIKKIENAMQQQLFNVFSTQEELTKFSEYENYDKQTKIFLLLNLARNLVKKYGNISQVFTIKNSVNIKKKKTLKKCLQNYLITEKEKDDKDFINLESIVNERNNEINNRKGMKDLNDMNNKFKVIKEVDEDIEEENEGEEENNNINDIKEENQDQIIEDGDAIENNNNNHIKQIINENEEIMEENNESNEMNKDGEIKYDINNINIVDDNNYQDLEAKEKINDENNNIDINNNSNNNKENGEILIQNEKDINNNNKSINEEVKNNNE